MHGWLSSLIQADIMVLFQTTTSFLKIFNCYFHHWSFLWFLHNYFIFNTNPKHMKRQPSYEWSAWHMVNKGSPMLLIISYLVLITYDLTVVPIKIVDIEAIFNTYTSHIQGKSYPGYWPELKCNKDSSIFNATIIF